jgi:hypothetical protein
MNRRGANIWEEVIGLIYVLSIWIGAIAIIAYMTYTFIQHTNPTFPQEEIQQEWLGE